VRDDAVRTGELPEGGGAAPVSPSDFFEPADDDLSDEPAFSDTASSPAEAPAAGFDPGVFRPSRAFLELRELLAANGAPEPSAVPEPRESAEFGDLRSLTTDPSDLSGLRPWLESFQQRLGPPHTGDLPELGDRG
jgi:hypothetical protein